MKKNISWRPVRDGLLVLLPILIALCLLHNALAARRAQARRAAEADTTPPQIHLVRDERYFVQPGETYEEEGYAAYDDMDGDLTKKVEVSVGREVVRYRVRDAAGNIAMRFRKIPYAEAP